MQYDNTNRGAIWKNENRRPEKNDPHFQGNINVGGVDYQLSGWKTDPEKLQQNPKTPLVSFSVRPKQEYQPSAQPQQASAPTPPPSKDVNDEIPF